MRELMLLIDGQKDDSMKRVEYAKMLGVNPSTYYRQIKGGVSYLDTDVARKYIDHFSSVGQAHIVKAILEHLVNNSSIRVDVSLT